MSDTIPSSEQAPATSPDSSLDSFHPLNYPALALQTYESFGGDPNRVGTKADFSSGKSTHLAMEYPKLKNIKQFDQTTDELNERLAVAIATFGEDSVTVSSIRYRLEEVEFLKIAHKLNNPGSAEERQESAEKFVELGERLYGIPDQELADSILGTLK